MTENNDDSFTSSKAEVFEALGHPTRIRILQELASKPLTYSDLKRAAGLESNGLLTFHLGKMRDLVRLNPEGNYALTDEGREALRIVEASKSQGGSSSPRPVHIPHLTAVLACLVVVLVVLAAVSAVEYTQIQGLDARSPVAGPSVDATLNATIYSGTASTPTSEGTAHIDVTFFYTTPDVPIPVSLTTTSSNGTSIAAYQCQSPTSCAALSTIYLKPFSGTNGEETLTFYYGSAVVSGLNYTCSMTIIAIGGISKADWPTLTAE